MYFWYETWGYSWDINGILRTWYLCGYIVNITDTTRNATLINEESDHKTWDFAGILFLDKPGLVLSP
jgi:hypothetical protein